jgi:hypothetical protein
MTVDPYQTTVLASGTDNQVRGWDIVTGRSLVDGHDEPDSSLFGKYFGRPITALLAHEDEVYVAAGDRNFAVEVFSRSMGAWRWR